MDDRPRGARILDHHGRPRLRAPRSRTPGSATSGRSGRGDLTVLVVEDIHWASAALLDLLEHLAETLADTRVLILCTARPEFLDLRPTWGAGKQNATTLALSPLSPERVRPARVVAARRGPDARDLRRPVLKSAEGNPFFLEEMLQMLIEEGHSSAERRVGRDRNGSSRCAIPDSVHGVIAARIDLLDAGARDALRRCSVVGRVFWPSALASTSRRRAVDTPRTDHAVAALGDGGAAGVRVQARADARRRVRVVAARTSGASYIDRWRSGSHRSRPIGKVRRPSSPRITTGRRSATASRTPT